MIDVDKISQIDQDEPDFDLSADFKDGIDAQFEIIDNGDTDVYSGGEVDRAAEEISALIEDISVISLGNMNSEFLITHGADMNGLHIQTDAIGDSEIVETLSTLEEEDLIELRSLLEQIGIDYLLIYSDSDNANYTVFYDTTFNEGGATHNNRTISEFEFPELPEVNINE